MLYPHLLSSQFISSQIQSMHFKTSTLLIYNFFLQMLFYTHAIPLPVFLALSPQLLSTASILPFAAWALIALNILSQFYCTHSVHELATKETSVTVTFILTLRKFASLLISTIVFKNNLNVYHVIGTVLVAIGTCVYFDFFSARRQRPVSMKTK